MTNEGILLIDKAEGVTSFSLVYLLRKLTRIAKIGHAGTLDPLATGVMIMLIGKRFTRKSDSFISCDKEYQARIRLGQKTDTYDREGTILSESSIEPSRDAIAAALEDFQGEIEQIPPMFSAKKVQGKKLYELARKGISIERAPCKVTLAIQLVAYSYPYLDLLITCSKGTYIRSLAHDLGEKLGCGAHLHALVRKRVGIFSLDQCVGQKKLMEPGFSFREHLRYDDL